MAAAEAPIASMNDEHQPGDQASSSEWFLPGTLESTVSPTLAPSRTVAFAHSYYDHPHLHDHLAALASASAVCICS
jgi:hypothetical protein